MIALRLPVQQTASWDTAQSHSAATDVLTTHTPKKSSSVCQHFTPPTTPARHVMQSRFKTPSTLCEICWEIKEKLNFVVNWKG